MTRDSCTQMLKKYKATISPGPVISPPDLHALQIKGIKTPKPVEHRQKQKHHRTHTYTETQQVNVVKRRNNSGYDDDGKEAWT